jgi:hypothetical protein
VNAYEDRCDGNLLGYYHRSVRLAGRLYALAEVVNEFSENLASKVVTLFGCDA